MKRATMEDVAREAGVSRALVSLAYRDAAGVSRATRARILDAGARLGYTHNLVAASLAGRGGNTLGVFLQDLHNDLFADVHDGLREVADAEGLRLVLAVGVLDGSRDAQSLDTLLQQRVDVLIAAGLQLPDGDVRSVANRAPLVCVARAVDGIDSVTSDDRLGARLATEHLLTLGHRDIVFLGNPPSDGYLDRGLGYDATMRDAGLAPRTVVTTYSRHTAAMDAAALLDSAEPPTAVFAHNDQAALGVLDALASRGLHAGRDVSVVGYDNSSVGRFPGTALTTVDVHSRSLGKTAASLALRRLTDPDGARVRVPSLPSLVIRATTGPPG